MMPDEYNPNPFPGFLRPEGVNFETYFDRQVNWILREIKIRFDAADKAVIDARTLMEDRMKDFPSIFIKKGDIDGILAEMKSEIKVLNSVKDKAEGRTSVALLSAAIATLVSVVGLLLRFYRV